MNIEKTNISPFHFIGRRVKFKEGGEEMLIVDFNGDMIEVSFINEFGNEVEFTVHNCALTFVLDS